MSQCPAIPAPVASVFATFPVPTSLALERVREVIFDVASRTPDIGAVTETLKWGQPSYATENGTPLRLGVAKSGQPALFAHCQTTVIADARAVFGQELSFEGNRAVVVPADGANSDDALRQIIHAALTYRLKR